MNLEKWAKKIHQIARDKGFYAHDPICTADDYYESKEYFKLNSIVPEKLALIHSEVSECLEAFRDENSYEMLVELADVQIRVLDLVAYLKSSPYFENIIKEKVKENKGRKYLHGRNR